jgi:hypothetical protein
MEDAGTRLTDRAYWEDANACADLPAPAPPASGGNLRGKLRKLFRKYGLEADRVIQADLFDERQLSGCHGRFDIVFSGGLIEHFQEPQIAAGARCTAALWHGLRPGLLADHSA